MQQVRLGSSGLHVSRVCLGMMSYGSSAWRPWVLDEDSCGADRARAVEAGITFFDTADGYSEGQSEVVTGRLLQPLLSRDELVIATKVFTPMTPGPNGRGLSRKHILAGIDASLARLGMDYVDLYQIHRFDPLTPVEETMQALHDVVRAGKARYIGASSMFAWQFAKLQHAAERHGWTRFVSMQNHYNLLYREEEREMIPLCHDQGVGIVPWSPLARGQLAGTRGAPASAGVCARVRHLPGRAVRTARGLRRDRPRSPKWPPPEAPRRRRSRSRGCCTSPPWCRSSARRGWATSPTRAPRPSSACRTRRSRASRRPTLPTPCGATIDALAPGARYERIDMLSYQVLTASPAGAGLLYWALRLMNPLKGGRA